MIGSPEDVVRLLQPELELLPQEEFRVLTLDSRHRVLASRMLSRGSVDSAPVRIAEAFREAVRRNAAAIAVAHNHPAATPRRAPTTSRRRAPSKRGATCSASGCSTTS